MAPAQKTIFVAIIGLGGVGKAFLSQLQFLRTRLAQATSPVDLRLILARRSTKEIFSEDFSHLDISSLSSKLESSSQPVLPWSETQDYLGTAPGRVSTLR